MISSNKTVLESLDLLWCNYHTISEKVNLEVMEPEIIAGNANAPLRDFRIASWLANQGFFIPAWSLWEFYSRNLCNDLSSKANKNQNDSHVDWVKKSLSAYSLPFTDYSWIIGANSLRNLFAHFCGRVVPDNKRAKKLFDRAQNVFPDLVLFKDNYVDLRHSHVAELHFRIENFIIEFNERDQDDHRETSIGANSKPVQT